MLLRLLDTEKGEKLREINCKVKRECESAVEDEDKASWAFWLDHEEFLSFYDCFASKDSKLFVTYNEQLKVVKREIGP